MAQRPNTYRVCDGCGGSYPVSWGFAGSPTATRCVDCREKPPRSFCEHEYFSDGQTPGGFCERTAEQGSDYCALHRDQRPCHWCGTKLDATNDTNYCTMCADRPALELAEDR